MIEATLARARLCGQPQQALCRRLHHRALRQPGRRACMPSSSRSTARSTWTSGAMSVRPPSAGWPPTSEMLADRARRDPAGGAAALSGRRRIAAGRTVIRDRQSVSQEKGPLANASGPSLGRKRPRRAAVARSATALQQNHRNAQNARAIDRISHAISTLIVVPHTATGRSVTAYESNAGD